MGAGCFRVEEGKAVAAEWAERRRSGSPMGLGQEAGGRGACAPAGKVGNGAWGFWRGETREF